MIDKIKNMLGIGDNQSNEEDTMRFRKFYHHNFLPKVDMLTHKEKINTEDINVLRISTLTAEGKLPTEQEFKDFNQVFSTFSTLSDFYFDYLEEEGTTDGASYYKEISESIKETFAKANSENDHQDSLNNLKNELSEFEDYIFNELGLELDVEKPSQDSAWGRVVKESIVKE